ncbi:MAG: Holliday junction resolvase RuvX [Albidovulum sp.]|nr:Holliday junction resolvase RuvX [Albidovulum sp.]MDE0303452.1 Holliday junction resolvase RuvX [Albidovulum sp.]MDE0532419.1 Holliday junction resolvase RuvX [Albidovulum sp.]
MSGAYDDICEFAALLRDGSPLVGLDVGTKTIGLAVSDGLRLAATPLLTVKRKKFRSDAQRILEIAEERDAGGFVVGLPKNMNGTEGPRCQSVRSFAERFSELTALPATFWDERLSSVAAERSLIEAGASRKKRKRVINHVAASLILQGALDRLRH